VTPARKASDGPVHADAGPVFADRKGLSADAPPGLARQPAAGTPLDSAANAAVADDDAAGSGAVRQHRAAVGVLADRLAAALVHHEPGWRLPRHSALARRYNVSTAEINAAVAELAARHLISRLPDGQLYLASPAEYLIPLEGIPRLASHLDPMGAKIACRSRQVSWRRVPEDIGWVLGVPPGDSACVVRLLWTADGEPAALATTYLSRHIAGRPAEQGAVPSAALTVLPLLMIPGTDTGTAAAGDPGAVCPPRALFVEMHPPPPSVARSLRLSAGQSAAVVTVRFDDLAQDRPAALAITVLRPDLFRIVVESPAGFFPRGTDGSFSGAWTRALQDWEP
jgi:DNA-binding GntR family transcriptional regulator